MDLLPAIDLRHGRVVRLRQGRDAAGTTFDVEPESLLADFARAGVGRVHVVDLDAAFGEPAQRALLASLGARRERPELELGGGVGTREACEWAFAAGFARGVVGSLVARDPAAFARLAESFPLRLVPALECAAGTLRVAGWTAAAAQTPDELAGRLRGLPCPALLVTDVERDGTLAGPNVELAVRLARAAGLPAILSGGVAGLADLRRAAACPEIGEAIVGRALLEGRFTVAQALAACRGVAA